MRSCFMSRGIVGLPSATANSFGGVSCGVNEFFTTEANGTSVVATAGTFSNFKITTTVAPGASKSLAFTFRVNGVSKTMTATISGTGTSASDIVNTDAVVAGDQVSFICVPTGTPTVTGIIWIGLEFTGTTAKASTCMTTSFAPSQTATNYNGVFSTDRVAAAAGATVRNVIAVPGTITATYMVISAAAGVGNSWKITLYKNGTAQDGTGGTPNTAVTISGNSAKTGNATYSLTVVAGDTIYMEIIPTSTPNAARMFWSVAETATTDGQFNLCGSPPNNMSATLTQYQFLCANNSGQNWQTTEANGVTPGLVTTFTFGKLQIITGAAAGAGKQYVLTPRVNSASPTNGPSVTISGASQTTGSDLVKTFALKSTDTWDMAEAPTGTPTATTAIWGLAGTVGIVTPGGGKKKGGGGLLKVGPENFVIWNAVNILGGPV